MTKPKQKLPYNKCRQCGHRWIPRTITTVCPKCHSYRWRTSKSAKTGRPRQERVDGVIVKDGE